jgi:limonene-1,2-epoxide hydrolase
LNEYELEALVRRFCEAFGRLDVAGLRLFFTEDVVYHNMPLDPVVGVEDTLAFIENFFGMCRSMTVEITHLAVSGNAVLTERVDTFTVGEREAPLPVMGTFEIVDGRIAAWRDYFDLGQVTAMFTA